MKNILFAFVIIMGGAKSMAQTTVVLRDNLLFDSSATGNHDLLVQSQPDSKNTVLNSNNAYSVGIGTTAPARKLDLSGDVQIVDLPMSLTPPLPFKFTVEIHSGEWQGLHLMTDHTDSMRYAFNVETTHPHSKAIAATLALNGGNPTDQFLVYGNGGVYTAHSVSIGTQNTYDGSKFYSLSVNGYARAKELKVYPGWADHVFQEDYALLSLDALKAYIQTHHHLPNIASASEVAENGINVGESNAKLLEKIEELTLYMLQLHAEIEQLKQTQSSKQ